jgi:amicoumacin kinase
MPLISVIMLSYNHCEYIECAINSVINQSYQDWELIIIDDCSTDGSQQLIKSLSEIDKRIRVIYHEANRGIPASTNEGIDLAAGKFFAFIDSDDMWYPDKLAKQIVLLEADEDLVVWSDGDIIDAKGSLTGQRFVEMHVAQSAKKSGDILESLIERNFIFQSSFIMKKENLNGIRYNEELKYLNDYQCVVDLAKKFNFYFIDESLAKYRVHGRNAHDRDPGGFDSDEIVLRTYFLKNYSDYLTSEVIYSNHARIVSLILFINQYTENDFLFKMKEIGLALPVGSTRRKIYDLAMAGYRILVNEGLFEFSMRFRAYIYDKYLYQNRYRLYANDELHKKYITLIILIERNLKRNMIYLEHEIAEKWDNIDFIILNFTDVICSSNRIKIINSSKRMGISEALNKAVSSCSGECVLITNEEIIDIRCLNELLNRSIKYNFLSESFYITKGLFNYTSVYSAKKDWLERIGGFDGQFLMDLHKDNNELEFVIDSLNYKMKLLNQASVFFNADLQQMRCLKKSANIMYECQINGEPFILRLIERPPEFAQLVKGEVNWIDYLANNGIRVSRAIPSLHGDYVATIKDESSCFIASCFIMSKGYNVSPDNAHEWNDLLFEKWGRIQGKMHALSKDYIIKDLSTSRPNWNYGPLFSPDLDLGPSENKILGIWRTLLNELESLPKDRDSYGLAHNDLHQNNILLYGSNIIVIDFDDCEFNWFACDIAIALYAATCTLESKQCNYKEVFIKNFLRGYIRENTIDSYYISLMPRFLKFREIYIYLFYLTNWNLKTINAHQRDVLIRLKNRIENEVPCIDVDFNAILEEISRE